MRQCVLKKDNKVQITWIDVKKSDQGRYVDIKADGGYDRNWFIESVSEVSMSKEAIRKQEQNYKKHRKATDI